MKKTAAFACVYRHSYTRLSKNFCLLHAYLPLLIMIYISLTIYDKCVLNENAIEMISFIIVRAKCHSSSSVLISSV